MPPRARSWIPLALAIGSLAAYALFFAMPYYVNDLNQFPLADVSGGLHDPKDLWPFTTAAGGFLQLGAFLTMGVGPFAAAAAAGMAAFDLWRHRKTRDVRRTMIGILTLAFAAATFAWIASPLGGALIGWMLD